MKKLIKFGALVAVAAIAFASCSGSVDPDAVKSSQTLTETIEVKGYSCKGWGAVNHLPPVKNATEGSTIEVYFNKGSAMDSWGYQVRMMIGDAFGDFALGTAFTFLDLEKDGAAEVDSVIEDIDTEWGKAPNLINKAEKEYPKTDPGKGKALLKLKLSEDNGGNDILGAFRNGKVTFLAGADTFVVEKMVLVSSVSENGVPVKYAADKTLKVTDNSKVAAAQFAGLSDNASVTFTFELNDATAKSTATLGYIRGKDGKKSDKDIEIVGTGKPVLNVKVAKTKLDPLIKTGEIVFVPAAEVYNALVRGDEDPTKNETPFSYNKIYYFGEYIPSSVLTTDESAKTEKPAYYIDPEVEKEDAYQILLDDETMEVDGKKGVAAVKAATLDDFVQGKQLYEKDSGIYKPVKAEDVSIVDLAYGDLYTYDTAKWMVQPGNQWWHPSFAADSTQNYLFRKLAKPEYILMKDSESTFLDNGMYNIYAATFESGIYKYYTSVPFGFKTNDEGEVTGRMIVTASDLLD